VLFAATFARPLRSPGATAPPPPVAGAKKYQIWSRHGVGATSETGK